MNDTVAQLYALYLQETGDSAAAASLTLADVMQSKSEIAETPAAAGAYTVGDVAERLGVSTKTVYRLTQDGQLHSFRVGRNLRFSPNDLSTYTSRCDVLSSELDARPTRKPRRP